MEVANAPLKTSHKFEDMYQCDPKAKYYGFKSWDGASSTTTPLSLVSPRATQLTIPRLLHPPLQTLFTPRRLPDNNLVIAGT